MDIKKIIGQRIRQERLAKGLSARKLALLTDDLKGTSIVNYELGNRTPGLAEIKQLSKALDVSPAFLMALTDEKNPSSNNTSNLNKLIPVLNHLEAIHFLDYCNEKNYHQDLEITTWFYISAELSQQLSQQAFALKMQDNSMLPEFKINDLIVIDPAIKSKPGDIVAVKLEQQEEILLRKYKQLSTIQLEEFELIALNPDWAVIHVNSQQPGTIIGKVVSCNRIYL